jgi:voltage-gated potassium channel
MPDELKLERWLDRQIKRARTPRGAAIVVAVVTTTITIAAGLAMTLLDRSQFPSFGLGLWWAVQTVTTVGYGDHVPSNTIGRLFAALVMLLGIGFVTVITASITSSFVAARRAENEASGNAISAAQVDEVLERLERIESALEKRP